MVHANWGHNSLMQMVLRGRVASNDVINVFHFEASAATEATLTTDALAQTWAQAVAADWIANCRTTFLAFQIQAYSLTDVVAQVLERPTLYEHKLTETTNPMANIGAIAADYSSLQAAYLQRWRTPVAGKHHRGRSYYSPVSEGEATASTINGAQITRLDAFGTLMTTRYAPPSPTGPGIFTVYSKPLDAGKQQWTVRVGGSLVVRSNVDYAGNSTNVTTFSTDPIIRTQRRRELGVGS